MKISKKVESALINHKRKLSLLLHNALDGKQLKGNKAQEYNSMMISDIADHINFINLICQNEIDKAYDYFNKLDTASKELLPYEM